MCIRDRIDARKLRDRQQRGARHRQITAHEPCRAPEREQIEHHEDRQQRGQPADREFRFAILRSEARLDRAPEAAEQFDHREA